jgi:hypothetical protein
MIKTNIIAAILIASSGYRQTIAAARRPRRTPTEGLEMGSTKRKAKGAAMDMTHGFAKLVAEKRAAELKCPMDEECSKISGPQVANEKTTELLTVTVQKHLYLSVVRRSFDIVIFCR